MKRHNNFWKRTKTEMGNNVNNGGRTNWQFKDEVVMPYDKANQHKNDAGKITEKWTFLLKHFGNRTSLETFGNGWKRSAELIQKTNPKHPWNLRGLEYYEPSMHLKSDKRVSIFNHMQDALEQSKITLQSVIPIRFLSSPHRHTDQMMEDSRQFSSRQVEALLVMAFFCMFPYRNSAGEMPSINFNTLYTAMDKGAGRRPDAAKAKMDCIWQYFASRTYEKDKKIPERMISFTRRSMIEFPDWENEKSHLANVSFSNLPIEDQQGAHLEVDFANKVIGGGVLASGAVQEEIRMVIAPEMIVARLFTTPLQDHEVLFIKGAKIFSKISGYSDFLNFKSFNIDMEKDRDVVAMDATEYKDPRKQFTKHEIFREINKAYCAFYSTEKEPAKIATGHWGCGVFGGDRELKAIIQLLAASKADRDIVYCMPGLEFQKQFEKTLQILKEGKFSIEMTYDAITKYRPEQGSLFKWLDKIGTEITHTRETAKTLEIDIPTETKTAWREELNCGKHEQVAQETLPQDPSKYHCETFIESEHSLIDTSETKCGLGEELIGGNPDKITRVAQETLPYDPSKYQTTKESETL